MVCYKSGFVAPRAVSGMARQLKDKICKSLDFTYRKCLDSCMFGKEWVRTFVQAHNSRLCSRVSVPVDYIRYLDFNAFSISQFSSIVSYEYCTRYITESRKVVNLDETGFIPGRDLDGTKGARVILASNNRVVIPNAQF